MQQNPPHEHVHPKGFRFYLGAGIFAVIPLLITFLVIRFVFNLLSDIGQPFLTATGKFLQRMFHSLPSWMAHDWLQSILAVLLTLSAFYVIGRVVTHVVGVRLIRMIDQFMEQIPLAKSVYGNTKKLLSNLQRPPGQKFDRVVLIEFPIPGMKVLGFVTAEMVDEGTGEKLVSVFVPTTPNPTSGFLEIMPYKNVVVTGWRVEEAMQYIISGGAGFPEKIPFRPGQQAD
jgi:uncharacterized membrane protein